LKRKEDLGSDRKQIF